jgi:hypothetical protein
MEKVQIKYLGAVEFTFSHGDVKETFAPNEVKEVGAYIAETLLREEAIERTFDKGTATETRTPLFEIFVEVPTAESLVKLTVAELLKQAEALKIEDAKKLLKAELIEKIIEVLTKGENE